MKCILRRPGGRNICVSHQRRTMYNADWAYEQRRGLTVRLRDQQAACRREESVLDNDTVRTPVVNERKPGAHVDLPYPAKYKRNQRY